MKKRNTIIRELLVEDGAGRPIRVDLRTCFPDDILPLIIVCHGFLGYKRWGFFPYLSERLAETGLHVLTISFSMNGVDEETGLITGPADFARNTVTSEVDDLRRTCRFIKEDSFPLQVKDKSWGLMGYSRGAVVTMIVASEFDDFRSIVTWATPSRLDRYSERRKKLWKREGALVFNNERSPLPLRLDYSYYEDIAANWRSLDLPLYAHSLVIPHLMVHGERDAAVTLNETMELIRGKRGERRMLEIISGCGHTFGIKHPMRQTTRELEKAITMTEEWFRKTLHHGEKGDPG